MRKLHILRHALGLTRSDLEYRNHYCPGGDDVAECERLEEMGLMQRGDAEPIVGPVFHVTEAGKKAARSGVVAPVITAWYSKGGSLMVDKEVEGVTQDLSKSGSSMEYYKGRYFVCETIQSTAAKRIAEAMGWEWRDHNAT